jgi:hypothetical protein
MIHLESSVPYNMKGTIQINQGPSNKICTIEEKYSMFNCAHACNILSFCVIFFCFN